VPTLFILALKAVLVLDANPPNNQPDLSYMGISNILGERNLCSLLVLFVKE
jgi:hypothetical protein